ncbi:GNAT family N-acetyltransferase [Pseudomonas frederiksbergensis]|uniref:GNAT family N-acetyltransferase n=1 Tax=Pseudomonas frederiksbergensis TaxID=104087 RepID=A0A423IZU1_9PSED|nr:GNAT family N-acetyltransferase [Pseudomonas frederiksbergensis]RON30897.1 GNAT family N-acetyltransferase [Pseudomonas frederiksbergensis]
MELSLTVGTHTLRLSAPDPEWCKALQHALNASFTTHSEFLPWAKPYTTEDEARSFLARAVDEFKSETGERRLFIVDDAAHTIIGCIGLKPRHRNRYVVGYWANTEYSGKGYMRTALEELIKSLPGFTFYLTIDVANVASQRLAEATGFGLIRKCYQARCSQQHGEQEYLYRLKCLQELPKVSPARAI